MGIPSEAIGGLAASGRAMTRELSTIRGTRLQGPPNFELPFSARLSDES